MAEGVVVENEAEDATDVKRHGEPFDPFHIERGGEKDRQAQADQGKRYVKDQELDDERQRSGELFQLFLEYWIKACEERVEQRRGL